jgi:low temperature requirement protein LtrA
MRAPDRGGGSPLGERRTGPVELLWDLVFVFALTQVTALLAGQLSWPGVGHGLLVLALIWWAWSAFVWAANAQDPDAPALRAALLLALVLIFIAGLAVPGAFGDDGLLFAVTYVGVRLVHLALYVDASRRGNASLRGIAGFAFTSMAGMALLLAGSLVAGALRAGLWAAAALIDYVGPIASRGRLRGMQAVAVAHFAERYGLFVIICLGESIVAVGFEATSHRLDARLLAAVISGLLVTVGLWWAYFGGVAAAAETRLRIHTDPVLAAADAYSYLHLMMVAGIIVFAVGIKKAIGADAAPLAANARLALYGGIALFLAGLAAFRHRIFGSPGRSGLVAIPILAALYAVTGGLAAWAVAATAAITVISVAALESSPP